MDTNLAAYEEAQAAYDEMMASNCDERIDPVLMEGYEDKREENSRKYRAEIKNDMDKSDKAIKLLDHITIAKFFATMITTVVLGTMVVDSCEWLLSLI